MAGHHQAVQAVPEQPRAGGVRQGWEAEEQPLPAWWRHVHHPVIQSYSYLSLEPMVIDIPLEGALSLNNIRVNVPSTFTVGISTDPVLMNNAAERLLNLHIQQVREQAQDIILGQLRLVIATLTIEEINKDREKFMKLINENVGQEINKIGLDLINVNIRDITDESGYIEAIGKRAAAEAINRAKVEVAQQERDGATGEALANREKEVKVAAETAAPSKGRSKPSSGSAWRLRRSRPKRSRASGVAARP
jgi:flotillin